MGKGNKGKKSKTKGTDKISMKKDLKMLAKHKKMLERLGERNIEEIVEELEQEEKRFVTVVEEECAPPTPRSNFTLVKHPEKEELILFGGELYNGKQVTVYNDMFFYTINKNQWIQLRVPGGPTARSGHQMVAYEEDGGQLWMFGGEHASPSQFQFYHYKDLWMFSLKSKKWELINAANGPSARSGHRMVISQQCLIIFGGFYDNYQSYNYYNDVHAFHLNSRQWLKIDVKGIIIPAPRSGCCMAACPDGKLLIWGGYKKTKIRKRVDRGLTYTDMFALIPNEDGLKWKWSPVCVRGHKSLPTNSVGFTVAPTGSVYCFGGVMDVNENEEDVHGHFIKDLLILNLTTLNWQLCEIKDKTIDQAAGGDANQSISEQTMEDRTTIDNSNLNAISYMSAAMPSLFCKQSRYSPTPRMNAGLCVCNDILYVYGGLYEDGDRLYTYNDFYALDLKTTNAWKVIIPNKENSHVWLESDQSDNDDDDNDKDLATATDTDDSGDNMDTE